MVDHVIGSISVIAFEAFESTWIGGNVDSMFLQEGDGDDVERPLVSRGQHYGSRLAVVVSP